MNMVHSRDLLIAPVLSYCSLRAPIKESDYQAYQKGIVIGPVFQTAQNTPSRQSVVLATTNRSVIETQAYRNTYRPSIST